MITKYDVDRWEYLKPSEENSLSGLTNNQIVVQIMERSNPRIKRLTYSQKIAAAVEHEENRLAVHNDINQLINERNSIRLAVDQWICKGSMVRAWNLVQKRDGYVEYAIQKYYVNSLVDAFQRRAIDCMEDEFEEIISITITKDKYTKQFASYLISYCSIKMYKACHKNTVKVENGLQNVCKLAEDNVISAQVLIAKYQVYGSFKEIIPVKIDEGISTLVNKSKNNAPKAMHLLGVFYRMGEFTDLNRGLSKVYLLASKVYDYPGVDKQLDLLEQKNTKSSSSSCFITSAVLTIFSKQDDCYELALLRCFRDRWLVNQKDGKKLIKEYYQVAPEIVAKIDMSENSYNTYKDIWDTYLGVCISHLELFEYELCKEKYISMVTILASKYLDNTEG